MIRREPEHEARGERIVGAEDRADETAAAAPRECDRLLDVVVRQQRAHRAEGLHRVDGARVAGIAAVQQGRRDEGAALGIGAYGLRLPGLADRRLPPRA